MKVFRTYFSIKPQGTLEKSGLGTRLHLNEQLRKVQFVAHVNVPIYIKHLSRNSHRKFTLDIISISSLDRIRWVCFQHQIHHSLWVSMAACMIMSPCGTNCYSHASLITSFQLPLECQYCSSYTQDDVEYETDCMAYFTIQCIIYCEWVWLCFFQQSFLEQHRRCRLCCSQYSPAGVQRASTTEVSVK